jgi:hypothetical protein
MLHAFFYKSNQICRHKNRKRHLIGDRGSIPLILHNGVPSGVSAGSFAVRVHRCPQQDTQARLPTIEAPVIMSCTPAAAELEPEIR